MMFGLSSLLLAWLTRSPWPLVFWGVWALWRMARPSVAEFLWAVAIVLDPEGSRGPTPSKDEMRREIAQW